MDWSTVEFGDPSELIIWLRDTGNVHDAGGPWAGNYIHFQSSGGEDTAKLAHELTHTLGLAHTHAIAGLITHPDARDPETGQPFQWADFWDLVYKPGSPNTYYSNRASAVGQGVLKEIDQHDQGNCSKDAHNRLTCYACQTGSYPCGLSWELLQWPCTDPACGLKGLAFTYKTPDNPNASFAWGVNAGSYYHTGDFTSISDSGIRLVRKFLRYDTVLNAESGNDHAGDWNRTSRRGHLHNRQPAWMLDFDSDGKRDVAFWNPPTAPNVDGVFQYRLSNTQTWVTKSMGRLGDIPVLADYNGDGVTDLAVYIPGGGVNHDTPITTEAYWRYCPTDPSSPSTPCPDNRGRIEIGERLRLTNRPVVTHLVVEPGAHVKIGDDVHIEHGCGVAASCSIRLGHRVTVGPFTLMMDTDYHVPGDPTAKPPASPIRIGNDVHIGSRVVVLRGADIGDGAWVGDGSVVSGTIPAGTRVAGVPARPIERPLQTASTDVRERVQQVVQRALRLPALPAMSQGPGELPGWD